MKKNVRFKGKNNNTIVITSGMTDKDVVEVLQKRLAKRQIEIDKRKWLVDEYISLTKKQEIDRKWLYAFEHENFSIEK